MSAKFSRGGGSRTFFSSKSISGLIYILISPQYNVSNKTGLWLATVIGRPLRMCVLFFSVLTVAEPWVLII